LKIIFNMPLHFFCPPAEREGSGRSEDAFGRRASAGDVAGGGTEFKFGEGAGDQETRCPGEGRGEAREAAGGAGQAEPGDGVVEERARAARLEARGEDDVGGIEGARVLAEEEAQAVRGGLDLEDLVLDPLDAPGAKGEAEFGGDLGGHGAAVASLGDGTAASGEVGGAAEGVEGAGPKPARVAVEAVHPGLVADHHAHLVVRREGASKLGRGDAPSNDHDGARGECSPGKIGGEEVLEARVGEGPGREVRLLAHP
jgi:hypothetical protein